MSEPEQVVKNFYDWYLTEGRDEIWPTFQKAENGYTRLNIQEIKNKLIKYKISETLIKSYQNKFKTCSDSLSKIKYEEFINIDDIEDIEGIGCDIQSDFWFADSFESPNDFEITSGEYLSNDIFLVYIDSESAYQKFKVTVKKYKSKWYINKIEYQ
ncbi:MAG: hypothetical protein F6K11_24145 [Leptolyngbya sp. SIO3F4]|nr:hypothetical protein [Leptolyngbya sp. SIO3F4]